MLDHELINRTLSTAMRTGGEFAEVFVEDKRSSSAVLDDGRVEELTSGRPRRRHPGCRRRYHGLRSHRRPLRGGAVGRRRGRCRRGSRWRWRGEGRRRLADRCRTFGPGTNPARGRRQSDQGRLAHPRQRSRSGPGQRDLSGVGPLRRLPSPHPGRQLRWCARRGRPGPHPLLGVVCRKRRHRSADRARVDRSNRRLRFVR